MVVEYFANAQYGLLFMERRATLTMTRKIIVPALVHLRKR